MKQYKFENLKITIHFDTAVHFSKNPFDGVLASLYANELKNNNMYEEFENTNLELPFVKNTNGIYHTSYPIVEDDKFFMEVVGFVKAYPQKLAEQLDPSKAKKVDLQRGEFKMCAEEIERYHIKKFDVYMCADKEKVEELLHKLNFFGKKTSLGFGKVEKIEIEAIENDYSLTNERGEANRILPAQFFPTIKAPKKALKRPYYPYWKKYGLEECFV